MSESTLRSIGACLALLGVGIATYITVADAGGGAPACVAGGHGCETVADSSYAHIGGIAVSAIGIFGYLTLLVAMLSPGDGGRFAALLLVVDRIRVQRLSHLPGARCHRRRLPVVRRERRRDHRAARGQRSARGSLLRIRAGRRSGEAATLTSGGTAMATKAERREQARAAAAAAGGRAAAEERRRRLVRLGARRAFLAVVVVGVLIAISQSGSRLGRRLVGRRRRPRSTISSGPAPGRDHARRPEGDG